MFIIASDVVGLSLEVQAFLKSQCLENSPFRPRVRVNKVGLNCESGISGILLIVDFRVVDISGFDVIFDMD